MPDWKKSSRLGEDFQIGSMPAVQDESGFENNLKDLNDRNDTMVWSPSLASASGNADRIHNFLRRVPSKFQDIAMGKFHDADYNYEDGRLLTIETMRALTGNGNFFSEELCKSNSDKDNEKDHREETSIPSEEGLEEVTVDDFVSRKKCLHFFFLSLRRSVLLGVPSDYPDLTYVCLIFVFTRSGLPATWKAGPKMISGRLRISSLSTGLSSSTRRILPK